jgi:hypothetical protein
MDIYNANQNVHGFMENLELKKKVLGGLNCNLHVPKSSFDDRLSEIATVCRLISPDNCLSEILRGQTKTLLDVHSILT